MLTRPRQRPVGFGDYKQKDWDVNMMRKSLAIMYSPHTTRSVL